jgi:hypothetical protein
VTVKHDGRRTIAVAVVGLGPIGRAVLEGSHRDSRFTVAACVKRRPDRDRLATGAGFSGPAYAETKELPPGPGVVVVCTSSRAVDILSVAAEALELGYDVVTTCEELIAPQLLPVQTRTDLDDAAVRAGRTLLAAGVNPGFAMDVLPASLSMATREITQIRLLRRVDVLRRRLALRDKVGLALTIADFDARSKMGAVGHVGLRSSVVFLADAMGWETDTTESLEPLLDERGAVVRGVRHRAAASDRAGVLRVSATLEMYAGARDLDRIELDGEPPFCMEMKDGIPGDSATVATVLNVAARAPQLPPGLVSMSDVLLPTWRAGSAMVA